MKKNQKSYSRILFGILLPSLWFAYSGALNLTVSILLGALSITVLAGIYTSLPEFLLSLVAIILIVMLGIYLFLTATGDQRITGIGILAAAGLAIVVQSWMILRNRVENNAT